MLKGSTEFWGESFAWNSDTSARITKTLSGHGLKSQNSLKCHSFARVCSLTIDTVTIDTVSIPEDGALSAMVSEAVCAPVPHPVTLQASRIKKSPGELVGVAGQVGFDSIVITFLSVAVQHAKSVRFCRSHLSQLVTCKRVHDCQASRMYDG